MHIDGEVISTVRNLPPSHGVGNLASAHLTERKVEQSVKVEVVQMPDNSDPVPIDEWSEESGEEDLLMEIITQGKPQAAKSSKIAGPVPESTSSSSRPASIPKSASAHVIGHDSQPPIRSTIPPSQSTDSSLAKGAVRDFVSDVDDDDDDDDDEMLYACIRSAKPTAKPVPPPRTSSISSKSSSTALPPVAHPVPLANGVPKNRPSRPPMELPKPSITKEVKNFNSIKKNYLQFY